MSLLDHDIISERYFFPRKDACPDPFMIEVDDGVSLACHRRPVDGAVATLIHFHGNGEVVGDYVGAIGRAFSTCGVETVFVEYRGYGASTGTPRLQSMLGDAEKVFAAVGRPAEQVIVFGRSVGSLYALEIVSRHPDVAGLILESGIADVHERVMMRVRPDELGVTSSELAEECRRHFNHEQKLSRYKGPLLVLHAMSDTLVEPTHGRRLHGWGGGDNKVMKMFAQGDHNTIMLSNWEEYWTTVRKFILDLM